jgi:hypothetical protein
VTGERILERHGQGLEGEDRGDPEARRLAIAKAAVRDA